MELKISPKNYPKSLNLAHESIIAIDGHQVKNKKVSSRSKINTHTKLHTLICSNDFILSK